MCLYMKKNTKELENKKSLNYIIIHLDRGNFAQVIKLGFPYVVMKFSILMRKVVRYDLY